MMKDNDYMKGEELETGKLTDWKNEPTVADLKADFTGAKTAHDSQVTKINQWLDNLNVTGSAKKKFPAGKSQVQPKLIRKQAEWRYSSLAEPLLSTYDLYDVSPVTAEDKDGAYQNQLVLNYQFNCKMNKQKLIDEYVRTGVDEGTIIAKLGWEFVEEEITHNVMGYSYEVASDPAMIQLVLQGMAMKELDKANYMVLPPSLKASIDYSIQKGGVPYIATPTGLTSVTEMVTTHNEPTVEICNYNNVTIDPSCEGDIDKANFVIYSFETSMSELEKYPDRYKNLDQIKGNGAAQGSEILATPDYDTEDESGFNFQDEPRKKFVAREYWGFWDIQGDGSLEPIVATWVGNTMIRMELNPFPDRKLPFVVVQYLPVRKEVYGEPDGALLEDNQNIIGAVTRGMIDIMARSANGQIGMRKDALDVPNKRRFESGKDFEFNPSVDPNSAIINFTYPEIPNSAGEMLALQNQDAESLTGVKAFASGLSGQALGDTATGIRSALDAASKRELGILRRLADGLVQIGKKVIAMNGEFLSEEEVVRVTAEEFVPVRRENLTGNFDLKLTVSTAEADNQKASELAFMLQTMGNSLPLSMSQIILADIARLRNMPDLAKKLAEYQPEPDPLQQLQAQKLQLEIAKLQSEVIENQTDAELNQAKTQETLAKVGSIQADTDRKNLDYVEEESGVNHARDLEKMQAQADANTRMKVIESALKEPAAPQQIGDA